MQLVILASTLLPLVYAAPADQVLIKRESEFCKSLFDSASTLLNKFENCKIRYPSTYKTKCLALYNNQTAAYDRYYKDGGCYDRNYQSSEYSFGEIGYLARAFW